MNNKIILLLFFVIVSCKNKKQENETIETNKIVILKSQFLSNKMEIGKITSNEFENFIDVNAQTYVPNQYYSTVSSPISGSVNSILYEVGDYVTKGQPIIAINSLELLDLQKEYAYQSNQTKYLKAEYERQKTLFLEKIASEKEFYKAESDYKTNVAMFKNIENKLKLIQHKNDFHNNKSFTIIAPISGVVTSINTNLASFVNSNDKLFEIIDNRKLQLQLKIFQEHLHLIKLGQSIKYNLGNTFYETKISKISKIINLQDKSIVLFASFVANDNQDFVANRFISCKIIVSKEFKNSLPSEAIIMDGKISYVLKLIKSDKKEFTFEKIPVKIGIKTEKYFEILSNLKDEKILTKGANEFF